MGEVYRARDGKLDRDVAIKVLRADVASDRERLARFEREARILAALNHPNIAHVIGLEDGADTPALVMELVEGPTLAMRIDIGALPLDEALDIAGQIAQALEAAHDHGIVHRDLKPANVKVRPDGLVKVLDFGLAKALDPTDAAALSDQANSPTITSPAMTMRGVILGTAAYMSPEQAKGRPVDRRADIWACGCVLFEMLTGRRAFEGEDTTETIAAVVSKEPDWTALPPSTPTSIRRLLHRMLVKNPKQRIDSAAVLRLELGEAAAALKEGVTARDTSQDSGAVRRWPMLPVVATGLVAAICASLATWAAMPRAATPSVPPVTRFLLTLPAAQPIAPSYSAPDLALSPDGTHLAYTVGLQSQLMIRALDQLDAVPVAETIGAHAPFFSPDGRWVGFFDRGGELRKVSIDGGRPIAICKVNGTSRGASWGGDDVIVFTTSSSAGLLTVPATGGTATMLASVTADERAYYHPSVLPDGHGIVFTVVPAGTDRPYVAHLDHSGQRTSVIRDASQPGYVRGGYLTYASGPPPQSLWAVRFAPATHQVSGTPVRVVEDLADVSTGLSVNVAVSPRGTLAYIRSPGVPDRTLAWINRAGLETPIAAPSRTYQAPRLSYDNTRLVIVITEFERANADLWTWDLSRGAADQALLRFTFEPGYETYAAWSRGGRIIYNAQREGVQSMFRRAGDLTGAEERLTQGSNNQRPFAVSPDERHLIFGETTTDTASNLMLLTLDGRSTSEVLLSTPFDEENADLSPDGRWMAYESNESGREEVYVRPFPDVNREVFKVSSNGGRSPAWSPSGGELFFVNGTTMHAVTVQVAPTFRHGRPATLFDRPSVLFDGRNVTRGGSKRMYDVSKDGQRFLVVKVAGTDDADTARHSIVVVHNWFENAAVPGR
jgi:serine/threonine-protein kinase